jgi:hypothetical protein
MGFPWNGFLYGGGVQHQDSGYTIQSEVEKIEAHEVADTKIRGLLSKRRDECFGPFL